MSGKDKTEARQRLDALRRGSTLAPCDGNATVGDVLATWQARALARREVAPATRDSYAWAVDRLTAAIGARRVRTFTVDDLETAYDRMSANLGHSSLVKLRGVLAQALDHAIRRGVAVRNVARIADLTPSARRPRRRRALTPDEATVLLRALEPERLGAMFAICLTVGLRPGEAAGLTWDDLNLDSGRMTVGSAVRRAGGRIELVDELKNDRARRTITLPAVTVEALRRHRTAQNAERLAASRWVDDRLVFCTTDGTPLEPTKVRSNLARITEAAGLGVIRPNELRHSAASILSDAGVPLEVIADVLGHTNTRMLELTYRHSVRPSIDGAVVPPSTAPAACSNGWTCWRTSWPNTSTGAAKRTERRFCSVTRRSS